MKRTDFTTALRDADRRLRAGGVPADVEERLEKRLLDREGPKRARTLYAVALAAVAACGIALIVMHHRLNPTVVESARLGWLEVNAPSTDLVTRVDTSVDGRSNVFVEKGSCTLVDRELRVTLQSGGGPLELTRDDGAVRVVRGRVDVQVEPRHGSGPPVRILVSDGTIEVVGTHFTIDQAEAHGSVTLHEGTIRFHASDGTQAMLTPGQTLAWPVKDAESSAGAPAASASSTPRAGARPSIVERLEYIQGLRSRQQWGRAAEELQALLREPLAGPTRERLSYELGSIYTYQLHDRARACAYWAVHRASYAHGRYDSEIEQALRSLHCADSHR